MPDEFGPDDLMEWQDMTAAIKKLEHLRTQDFLNFTSSFKSLYLRIGILETQMKTLQDVIVGLNTTIAEVSIRIDIIANWQMVHDVQVPELQKQITDLDDMVAECWGKLFPTSEVQEVVPLKEGWK